jgi:curli biogenesis system outer membrane secretion channel CsgG
MTMRRIQFTLHEARGHWCIEIATAALLASVAGCADVPAFEPARVDATAGTRQLKALPRKAGELTAVSIYEFRSSVGEIPSRGATDMFKAALVNSGQFRVVERSRLSEGVVREKQLNAGGLTGGQSATEKLTEAKYLFEGTITQANAGETQRAGAFGIAGAQIGGSTNRDVIGVDVRVVEVGTGDVVAAVAVQKAIASDSTNISGISSLLGSILAKQGKSTTYVPDVQMQQQRKQSLDVALRAAIDQAVIELSERFSH